MIDDAHRPEGGTPRAAPMDASPAPVVQQPSVHHNTEVDLAKLPIGQIAAATLVVLAIVGAALLLVQLTRFFMLVFAAVVIGAIFDTIANVLCRKIHMPRPLALLVSVLGLIAIIAGVFMMFGTQLAAQMDTIEQTIPAAVQNIETYLDNLGWGDRVREITAVSSDDISAILSQAGGYVLAAGSSIADLVLILVGAIFLASDPATYRRGLLLLVPKRAEKTVEATLDDASHGLRGWMLGQSVSSLVIVILTWAGLSMLGVPASGGLGLIAGLLDVIPMIGPVIAGIPAVLLAFTVSPMTALWTILVFLLIQQLQGNFLQPMIQKQAVNVPPAVLLFAVIAAGLLFGFMGVLLASPLTVVSFVIVQRIYVKTLLGKEIDVAGHK
ncbi:MAG TPA: AI-2E family transporter [Sphingopyxis sp.]|nr:AI-2E family transporter [Sphingopyxis sp.]